jgi:hypothetical protein
VPEEAGAKKQFWFVDLTRIESAERWVCQDCEPGLPEWNGMIELQIKFVSLKGALK